jgi:hypothetical protein
MNHRRGARAEAGRVGSRNEPAHLYRGERCAWCFSVRLTKLLVRAHLTQQH